MRTYFSGLWTHPDFLRLWLGQTLSEFGTRITRDGLPLVAVLTIGASPAQLGVLTAIGAIPVLIFGLIAGVWIDRLPRRPILIAADLARAALLLAVPAAALTGHLSFALLLIITPILSVLTLIYTVAYRAYLPSLIPRDDLLEGNTKLATTAALAEVGGPAIAGVLIQAVTAPIAILFDVLSYVISALCALTIRHREAASAHAESAAILREVREGFTVIASNPLLRATIGALAARMFFGNFYAALYSYYVVVEVGLSPALLGLLVSAGGIGALAGALINTRVTRRFGLGRTLCAALLINALVSFTTPAAASLPALAVLLLLIGQLAGDALMMIYGVNEISLRQMLVPDHLLGRANASVEFLSQGIASVGALIGGLLGGLIGAQAALLLSGVGSVLAALWLIASPVAAAQSITALQPPPEPIAAGEISA